MGEWTGVLLSEIVVGDDSAMGDVGVPFQPKKDVILFEVLPDLEGPLLVSGRGSLVV
jgi:hypothetical protein